MMKIKYSMSFLIVFCCSCLHLNAQKKDSLSIKFNTKSTDSLKKVLNKEYRSFKENHKVFSKNKETQKMMNSSRLFQIQQQENTIRSIKEQMAAPQISGFKILQETKQTQETAEFVAQAIVIDDSEEDEGDSEVLDRLEVRYNVLKGPSKFDSRVEVAALDPDINWQLLMLLANNSVGLVVEKSKLTKVSSNYYQLDISTSLKNNFNLCENVPFGNQPISGVGTAFIVGESSMITAGHVFQRPAENYAIVFNFDIKNTLDAIDQFIPKSNVYFLKKEPKIHRDIDIASFNVDRNFTSNRPILKLGNSNNLEEKHKVYMIGHPSGLPKKIAINASILNNKNLQFFFTSLDSFQGNSGSPVFNFKTNEVIGVLVSGVSDFYFNGNCNELNVCKIPFCEGEKVIRAEIISSRIDD